MSEETFEDLFKEKVPGIYVGNPCDGVEIEVELLTIYASAGGGPFKLPDKIVRITHKGKLFAKNFSYHAEEEAKEFAREVYKALRRVAASKIAEILVDLFL